VKVDLDAKILDLRGKPISDSGTEMTLSHVICGAMLNTLPTDQDMKVTDKVRMFGLAERAVKGGEQEFSLEDLSFIKERVGRLFGPLVVGRTFSILC